MRSSTYLRCALIAAACLLIGATKSRADSAVINFTADLTSYTGTPTLSPFVPGTALNALINGQGGFAGLGSDDWQRFTGQVYIPNFTGDGTYTATPDGSGGAGIYLHSPLLNRIEAVSLRTESPLTADSLAASAGRADGNPTQNRDDIYLPDFEPNAVTTITISGNEVTIDYFLDFQTLDDTNAAFLRNGVTPTQIGDLLLAEGVQFGSIGVTGNATAAVQSATIGSGVEDTFPYGGFNLFDAVVSGNLSNTIVPTTRGVIDNEIAANNITPAGSGGRQTSEGS